LLLFGFALPGSARSVSSAPNSHTNVRNRLAPVDNWFFHEELFMRRTTLALAIIAGLTVWTLAGRSDEKSNRTPNSPAKDKAPKPDPKKVKELMARKLEHSQKMLAALIINDFDKAAKNAEELMRIRKEASFLVVKTPFYERWSDDFSKSAEKIIKASKEKNQDAAKLGYLEMTLTCFNCHTYVRDLGDIRHEIRFQE
jgi:hypothetical protein